MSKLTPITTDNIDEMYNSPIGIHDAASMLRRRINPNDKPYTQAVVKRNNIMIDEWYETVLKRIADRKGMIAAGRVFPSWTIFLEGKEIYKFQEYKQHFPMITQEMIQYWVNYFTTKSVEEMHASGTGTVALGWQILSGAIRTYFAEAKWRLIYSLSEDPYDWERAASKYPKLLKGQPMPFDLEDEMYRDIVQKVQTILGTKIQPDN